MQRRLIATPVLVIALLCSACTSAAEITVADSETGSAVDVAPEEVISGDVAEDEFIEPSRIREVRRTPASDEIGLQISNQDLDIDPMVRLEVQIDGVIVLSRRFDVGDQHLAFNFIINEIDPGEHTMTFISDSGVEFSETFVKEDAPLWVDATYWNTTTGIAVDIVDDPELIQLQ